MITDNHKKQSLLMILPGPLHDVEQRLNGRLYGLSKYYEGSVISTGWRQEKCKIGSFDVSVLCRFTGRKIKTGLLLLRHCIKVARHRKKHKNGYQFIVTYDPLKTGLFGLLLRAMYGGMLIVEINGDYAEIENYDEHRFKLVRYLKRYIYMKIESFVVKRADGIKLLYPDQIAWLNYDKSKKTVHTYFNYSGLERFCNIKDNNEVLFVGSPYYLKGVDLLIAAFKTLSHKHPLWRLKIVGWFLNVDEVLADIDMHPNIEYCKAVQSNEITKIIGSCSFLVLPSRTEAMGRVLLEAMACGKPRIGSNVGGIPTVIEHGVDGFLFEKNNVTELIKYMDLLISDKNLREQMGCRAKDRVGVEFTLDNYVVKTKKFYSDVMFLK